MKFLLRSYCGESLALALRLMEEGNTVRLYIKDKEYQTIGNGLVEKTKDIPGSVSWADVVVFDSTDHGSPAEAERMRKAGIKVVGTAGIADQLEHDRDFALQLVEQAGIAIPTYERFKGPAAFVKAQQFLSSQDVESGWAFKPDGPHNTYIKTFVAHTREEMLRRLTATEDLATTLSGEDAWKPDFVLQEKVDGIEVSTEAWFTGTEFVLPNGTLERKYLMDGDLGEQTGCMGNLVWRYPDDSAPLYRQLLLPLVPTLKGKYNGPIDVNAIIDEDGTPWFLEFTPRFGYSAIFALSTLVGDFGRLLADTAHGKPYADAGMSAFAAGVRMTTPPYPYTKEHIAEGRPIFGWDGTFDPHIHPLEVRVGSDGLETAGPDGIPFEVTAHGATVREASAACYERLRQLYVPDMRYRTDIGEQAERDYAGLIDLELVEGERTGQTNDNDWF